MKPNYLIKLNGKTIFKRSLGKKSCTLKILNSKDTGTYKVTETFYSINKPKYLVSINDNPSVIFYDWNVFKKQGNDFVAEFKYSPTQQKIDIIKQGR